jgi:hypothetical protein
MTPQHQEGLILHEFGHAADVLYPAMLHIHGGEVVKELRNRQTWKKRGNDAWERDADAIGGAVMGKTISYAGSCTIQTTGRGQHPRPAGLR